MGYAHCGEDNWILSQFPENFTGYAVELGALDGVYLSNTMLLEEKGWEVLCIEPNPHCYPGLKEKRKNVLRCACWKEPGRKHLYENQTVLKRTATSIESQNGQWIDCGEVNVLTLNQCLEIASFPQLDVLSLDVDGLEEDILEGFDIQRWSPKVVVLEEGHAGRLGYMRRAGYRIEATVGHNLCYVRTT